MFPFCKQFDSMDCGPACLKMIAEYYGKKFSLQKLRDSCHITHLGVSLLGISDAATLIGLKNIGMKLSWEQLISAPHPCIIHWKNEHFVVLYKIKRRRNKYYIYVADPAQGLLKYSDADFIKYWKINGTEEGVVLFLETTPEFYENNNDIKKSVQIKDVLNIISQYKFQFIQICIAMLFALMINIAFPFLTKAIVDRGIVNKDIGFIYLVLFAQVALVIGQFVNSLFREWLMLHTTSKLSIILISKFINKLMNLPISFFDTKRVGDILQRIGDFSRIQSFLTGTILNIVISLITFIVYSVITAQYNYNIFIVFLVGSILYICWAFIFLKRRRLLDSMRFKESTQNQDILMQLIQGMQDIKMNGCELKKRWEWEDNQVRMYDVKIKSMTLGQVQSMGGVFIDQTKNIIISVISATSVIEGNMTFGMMIALQYIIGQLNAPLYQFIAFIQQCQDAKISMERLNEIQEINDENFSRNEDIDIPDNSNIIFEDVTFQYEGPNSNKILNNINATFETEKITAVVGTSGSGKSTLMKMMLGFYMPVSGKVSLNGNNLYDIKPFLWRKNCGVVMQEGYIFSDTIENNICLCDNDSDPEKFKRAIKIANAEDFIYSLPLKEKTKIGNDGHGLSVGQKQRILIARAVYKDAKYLFLDEATNSLDTNNEVGIMSQLQDYFIGKTVVVIAHRLSTVVNADKIIVLDNGVLVEEGSHQELISNKSYYYNLIKNQLYLEHHE